MISENTPPKQQKFAILSARMSFTLFLILMALDFADQNLMSPLLNPILQDFFGSTTDSTPLGWIQSVISILSALSMIVAGILADRGFRKMLLFGGSLVYSIFSIITALTPHGLAGYQVFFFTRAMNGIGIGTIVPTIFSLVSDMVDSKKRSLAFSYITVAQLIGQMAGIIFAGNLELATGEWRNAYLYIGILNFIFAFGILFITEPKRGAQEGELKELLVDGAEYRFKLKKEDWKLLLTNKSNVWLVCNFIDTFPGAIILFLIFKYMEDIHNIQADTTTIIIAAVAIFGGVGNVLFGLLGDKWFQKDQRAKVMVALFCNAFPIVFVIAFLSVDFRAPNGASMGDIFAISGFWILIVSIVIAMFINQGVGPNWLSSIVEINLPEHRATMLSLASFMDLLGKSLGPLFGSYIQSIYGIRTAMWSVIIFWIVNIFIWIPVFFYIRNDIAKVHLTLDTRAKELKK